MDYPLDEIEAKANAAMASIPNSVVYFKFTCENCRSRQTFDVPNTLYTTGKCEECGHVTTIKVYGFNLQARLVTEMQGVPESER